MTTTKSKLALQSSIEFFTYIVTIDFLDKMDKLKSKISFLFLNFIHQPITTTRMQI